MKKNNVAQLKRVGPTETPRQQACREWVEKRQKAEQLTTARLLAVCKARGTFSIPQAAFVLHERGSTIRRETKTITDTIPTAVAVKLYELLERRGETLGEFIASAMVYMGDKTVKDPHNSLLAEYYGK